MNTVTIDLERFKELEEYEKVLKSKMTFYGHTYYGKDFFYLTDKPDELIEHLKDRIKKTEKKAEDAEMNYHRLKSKWIFRLFRLFNIC